MTLPEHRVFQFVFAPWRGRPIDDLKMPTMVRGPCSHGPPLPLGGELRSQLRLRRVVGFGAAKIGELCIPAVRIDFMRVFYRTPVLLTTRSDFPRVVDNAANITAIDAIQFLN